MRKRILTVVGTRSDVIKLAPVIRQLEAQPSLFATINVTSVQHTDLLYPFTRLLEVRIDHDLQVMEPEQTPSGVCARVLAALDPLLVRERPDLVLVQGDTTTAMAAALAAFHRVVPVGHVEAGLRSGSALSPFPEEMNRRLITQLASYHFAATRRNRDALLAEGVANERVFVTGNPGVDSLKRILHHATPGPDVEPVLEATAEHRRIVLTTHRPESFGAVMLERFRVLRRFVDRHADVAVIFPVHPNPAGVGPASAILQGHERIHLLPALGYDAFVALLSRAWLVVSDSGGLQEEAPTLGKPLLVLGENTERPEAIEAGVARLVGGRPERLALALEQAYRDRAWSARAGKSDNPFGHGDSGVRIAHAIARVLGVERAAARTR